MYRVVFVCVRMCALLLGGVVATAGPIHPVHVDLLDHFYLSALHLDL